MIKRCKYILLGAIIGIGITFSFYGVESAITRFKTPLEIEEKVKEHELKQEYKNTVITKDTVKSNAIRITRLERYIFDKGK